MKSSYQLGIVLTIIVVCSIAPALINIIVDPYHAYGAKSKELINLKPNARYQSAFLIRTYLANESLGFDTVIIGNSHSVNFSPNQIEQAIGKGKVIKLSMGGSTPKRQSIIMNRVFEEPALSHVFWVITPEFARMDPERLVQRYAFPDGLYGHDLVLKEYAFNWDIFIESLIDLNLFNSERWAPQGDAYGSDYQSDAWWNGKRSEFINWIKTDSEHSFHRSNILARRSRIPNTYAELASMYPDIEFPNIDRLAEHARKNPDVEFSFVITPHPLPLYAGISSFKLAQYIGMRRYAANVFSELPNARVYGFDDVEEIVGDFSLFKDSYHYHPSVNAHMVDAIGRGSNELIPEMIPEYEQRWLDLIHQFSQSVYESPDQYPGS